MTVSVKTIPVVDIHADNLIEYWPALTLAIHSATFIALDLEMSGIGNRKDTMTRNTEDRYKAYCEIAKTRSVLALGISIFQRKNERYLNVDNEGDSKSVDFVKDNENISFVVQTFNVMVIKKDSFTVEPSSLRFLVEHGFDFNKHYAKGIPYHKNDIKGNKEHPLYTISNLFFEILRASKPVVLHNGILDLVFLYENFYADLPSSSLAFLADLSEMFPAGVFDTKFIAEYHTDNSATFLNYIFKKNWRLNLKNEADSKCCVTIECFQYPSTADVCYNDLINKTSPTGGSAIPCEQFAAHGHCSKGMKCDMSHDLDVILDHEAQKKEKKRSRKRKRKGKTKTMASTHLDGDGNCSQGCPDDSVDTTSPISDTSPKSPTVSEETSLTNDKPATVATNSASGTHRAGFDAFMTGFCMATYFHRYGNPGVSRMVERLPDFVNKLNLSGKDVPLKITKSQYCKTSTNHNETWKKVMSSAS